MRDWRKILSSWWTKMWSHFCIMESGGYQGIPKLLYQAQISFSSKANLSLTCCWAKVSAGRKFLSSTSQARSLNFAILKVKKNPMRWWRGTLLAVGRREEVSDPCCEAKFANVIYTIRLWRLKTDLKRNATYKIHHKHILTKYCLLLTWCYCFCRRPTFYMINYILPAILINVGV